MIDALTGLAKADIGVEIRADLSAFVIGNADGCAGICGQQNGENSAANHRTQLHVPRAPQSYPGQKLDGNAAGCQAPKSDCAVMCTIGNNDGKAPVFLLRAKGFAQSLFEVDRREWLLQDRNRIQAVRNAGRAIAGGKNERDAAGLDRFRDRKGAQAIQIDVEDRDIEVERLRFGKRVVEPGGDTGEFATDVGKHVLDQHDDHRFVLHQKDSPPREIGRSLVHKRS